MEAYMKPPMNWSLDHITLHCGTNNCAEENPESTAENYIPLAKKAKTEPNLAPVCYIIPLTGIRKSLDWRKSWVLSVKLFLQPDLQELGIKNLTI